MKNKNMKWIDCGCCGRTHESLYVDCRAFVACPKCGDCYWEGYHSKHVEICDGVPQSLLPTAIFEDEDENIN